MNDYFNPWYPNLPAVQNNYRQQNTNVNWIDVSNINDVQNITVQPNTTAWIRFVSEPVIAMKTSDSMGICTTEYFKIEKIEMNQPTQNADNFVTKDDFQQFVKEFSAKFDNLTKQNKNNKEG